MVFENPLAQGRLPFVEGQVPVAGRAQLGLGAADGAVGVDEVGGVERRAAGLALVAVGLGVVAVGTLAGHVAVGKELLCLGVVELLGSLLYKFALVIKMAEELRRRVVVDRRGGARIYVERNTQSLERLLNQLVIAVYYILWGHTLGTCLEGDGHAMLVAAADKQHVATGKAHIARINICRDIYSGQVADMHGAVGIGKGRGNEGTLIFFTHFFAK